MAAPASSPPPARSGPEHGIEPSISNRGKTALPPRARGARLLQGDIRDPAPARAALGGQTFDVVVNWIAFTPEQVESDLGLFRGRTGQYVFIGLGFGVSGRRLRGCRSPNPRRWGTLLGVLPQQDRLRGEAGAGLGARRAFPATIVRPSHTYDKTLLPVDGGWTVLDRMRRGKKVIVHGDGTSLWTLTHHEDFAKAFVGLLGCPGAVGDSFHITSDEALTWNQIFETLAAAAGTEARVVHVPSDLIAAFDARWGAGLLGDKAHSMVFDNTKIKRLVPEFVATIPFWRGAREILAWYDADPARQKVNEERGRLMDQIIDAVEAARPAPAG